MMILIYVLLLTDNGLILNEIHLKKYIIYNAQIIGQ